MTDATRPRILLVTRNLPPLVGGMERLNWHMAEELAKVADVRVVGPAGSAALAPAGVVVCEAPLEPLWRFLWRARQLARREARVWKPDLVLAGSGLTAPLVRTAARICGAKSAAYLHGLDIAARHPLYRALWLPAIRGMDRVIANSHATAELGRGIGVNPERIGIIHPGVDLPAGVSTSSDKIIPATPHTRSASEAELPASEPRGSARRAEGMPLPESHPLLLSVGRLSARKGLREFVAYVLPRIVEAQPEAMLLIVGDVPSQALHAEAQTPASIRAVADAAGVGGHIKFLGTITDYRELGAVYRAADVHVFPIREIPGDPEGFGMVAVEAAAHGLPTVGFATGGVVDAVAEGKSGHLVASNDYPAFAEAVLRTVAEREQLRASCVDFARRFTWPEFGAGIARLLGVC